jgi:hypothetical protein
MQPEVVLVMLRPFRTGLKAVEKIQLRIAPEVGKTKSHALSEFAFQAINFFASLAGIGISRSL